MKLSEGTDLFDEARLVVSEEASQSRAAGVQGPLEEGIVETVTTHGAAAAMRVPLHWTSLCEAAHETTETCIGTAEATVAD